MKERSSTKRTQHIDTHMAIAIARKLECVGEDSRRAVNAEGREMMMDGEAQFAHKERKGRI